MEVHYGNYLFAYSVLTQQNSWQSTLRYTIILIGALLIIAYLLYFYATNAVTNTAIFGVSCLS